MCADYENCNQAFTNQAINLLETPLTKSVMKQGVKTTWHHDPLQFPAGEGLKSIMDLSPGWFAQG
jgi:hypothetical protein